MSCYHPKTLYYQIDKSTGEVVSHFSGKEYYTDDFYKKLESDPTVLYTLPLPCGQCVGCKLDYSSQWADRMSLEYQHTGKAVFVTLTYNDEHLKNADGNLLNDHELPSLCKRDVQLFFKRLRRKFPVLYPSDEYPKAGIRFYCSGEYGPLHGRPHYHLIIFGLDLMDFADEKNQKYLYLVGRNELGQAYYDSDILKDLWTVPGETSPIGFVGISEVSYQTFAYVARYTLKKAFNELSPSESGLLNEFSLMSRRPGLGAFYLAEHPELVYDEDGLKKFVLPVNTSSKGSRSNVRDFPKFIINKLEKVDSELFYKIKSSKQAVASDRFAQELSKTDKDPSDYLCTKERKLVSSIDLLKYRKEL